MHVFPGLYPWLLDDFTAEEWSAVLKFYDAFVNARTKAAV